MTYSKPKIFTLVDPRTVDGTPFYAAGVAAAQVGGLVILAQQTIPHVRMLVRNAELERQCQREEKLDAAAWEDSPEGRQWQGVEDALVVLERRIRALQQAAAYDPKNPPKEA